MKKTIALITVAALVLIAVASLVNAAPAGVVGPGPRWGGQQVTLTDEQKQELAPLYDKMLDAQKQIMQKYVDYGYLTQEQADQQAAWMKDRLASRQQYGYGPGMMGFGRGFGPGAGRGPGYGPGYGRGPCWAQ